MHPQSTPAPCSVDGCERHAVARSFCQLHWRRWRSTGDPGPVGIIVERKARTRYDRPCLHCGRPVATTPYRDAAGLNRYCSRECVKAARLVEQDHKVCSRCGIDKPASEFSRNWEQPRRLRPECLSCRAEQARSWRERNPTQVRQKRLKQLFGLTVDQYDALHAAQAGGCAICSTALPGSNFPQLAVDHDHQTGYVRGLLCAQCNAGLGAFGDDPARLAAAIAYLERPPALAAGISARRERPILRLPSNAPCPYCGKTYINLSRHMHWKHKEAL